MTVLRLEYDVNTKVDVHAGLPYVSHLVLIPRASASNKLHDDRFKGPVWGRGWIVAGKIKR